MKNPLLWKSVSLALLVIVLMIPLSMVRSVIAERADFRHEAQQDIATSWGGEQRLVGPLLVQEYEILVAKEAWDEKLDAYVEKTAWEPRTVVLFPERLEIRGDATCSSAIAAFMPCLSTARILPSWRCWRCRSHRTVHATS